MNRFILWVIFVVAVCGLVYSAVMLFLFPETEEAKSTTTRNNAVFDETKFEEGPHKKPE